MSLFNLLLSHRTMEQEAPSEFKKYSSAWLLAAWSLVILYTVMVFEDVTYAYKLATLAVFFVSVLLLLISAFEKRERHKTVMWVGIISLMSAIVFMMHTVSLMDNTMMSAYLSGIVVLSSLSWCCVGHCRHQSESGWYWYIWSLTLVAIVCIAATALQTSDEVAAYVFSANILFAILIHLWYIYHLVQSSATNPMLYQNIFRVSASGTVSVALLVGFLIHGTGNFDQWLEYILGIEGAVFLFLLVDIGLVCACSSQSTTFVTVPKEATEP